MTFKLHNMAPGIPATSSPNTPFHTLLFLRPYKPRTASQTKAQTSTLSCFCMSLEGPHPHPFVHLAKFYSSPKAQLKCHFSCLVLPDPHPHPPSPESITRWRSHGTLFKTSNVAFIKQDCSELFTYLSPFLNYELCEERGRMTVMFISLIAKKKTQNPKTPKKPVPWNMPENKHSVHVYATEPGKPLSSLDKRETK